MSNKINMTLQIDEQLYPELFAALEPLGKGTRTEMVRQLAQEALVRRQVFLAGGAEQQMQQAASMGMPGFPVFQQQGYGHPAAPITAPAARPAAPTAAANTVVRELPAANSAPSSSDADAESAPSERRASVLPTSLLREG